MPGLPKVLITDTAGIIGRTVVHLFDDIGWRVVGVNRTFLGEKFPGCCLIIHTDISNPETAQHFLRMCVDSRQSWTHW